MDIIEPTTSRDQIESHVFTFGDPEPVLRDNLIDYLGVFQDLTGPFYVPPVDLRGLSRLRRANPHHGAILSFKRNMISTWFRESPYLSHEELEKAALDFVVLENCYFQKIYNRLGGLLALKRLPAITMRRGVDPEVFFQAPQWSLVGTVPGQSIEFRRGEVIHLKRGDIEQDIYGVPEYLGGMQSVLLSEDATLFRRRFYKNGAAMGYVFVTADCNFSKDTSEAIEAEIKRSVGTGNFRNLYINIPKTTSRDPVKVLPIGDIKTADDYDKIKSMNMREVLAMHRMQPGIAGIIPENTSGLGDLVKARQVYWDLEVPPLQKVFLRLNDHLPLAGRIGFDNPSWATQPAA